MPSALPAMAAPVVIAIDPHKASWTAVAAGKRLQLLATIRVEVNRGGYRNCAASPAADHTPSGRSKAQQVWVLH